ncbi:PEP-CTERM sorting domain-containing protein [Methylobacillus caricis]|uniref:PEP-CTERM sorting domain-containing protein n=1 Tax=Methylobacillus caricis TaxID=1971611 RepID=UPI001CFF8733|nr:PEP-CTERM sorting domain-containing protein [Methylobacillus caricis]MCB5187103.1 PEP-CTERM sorting domain-containing protein [Methylobacillus caricis]
MLFKDAGNTPAKPYRRLYYLPMMAMLAAVGLAENAHAAVSGTNIEVFTAQLGGDYYSDGGIGISASAVNEGSFTPNSSGTAASAALSGPSSLPTLKVKTAANDDAYRWVWIHAFQAFDVLSHGSNILNISFSGEADGRVEADILVFKDSLPSGSDDELSRVAFLSAGTVGELAFSEQTGRYTILDYWHGGIGKDYYDDGTYQTVSGSLNLGGYAPGEVVYVWVAVEATAINGTSVDASHTLTMSWDNPSQFSAIAAVPEPTAYAMFLAGLGLLGFMRRRTAA